MRRSAPQPGGRLLAMCAGGQARKAVWDAVNPHTGKRRIDEAFPRGLRATTREDDMLIRFTNGATWQVVGSDNYDSLVGAPPVGVVFSEWALADPQAWAYIRPILAENGGWALCLRARGRNRRPAFYEASRADRSGSRSADAEETGVSRPRLARERREYVRDYGAGTGRRAFARNISGTSPPRCKALLRSSDGRRRAGVRIGRCRTTRRWSLRMWDLGSATRPRLVLQRAGQEVGLLAIRILRLRLSTTPACCMSALCVGRTGRRTTSGARAGHRKAA